MSQLVLFGDDESKDIQSAFGEICYDKFDLTGRRCRRFRFNGEWYYVLYDYALTMGIRDAANAQRQIDPEEITDLETLISSTTQGGVVPQLRKDVILTTRNGLYQLSFMVSRKFRLWVFSLIDESLGIKPKTVIDGKIAKEQKRLGCDRSTAKERAESRDFNREIKSPFFHRAIWKGVTGRNFNELTEEVGPRPLDRSSAPVLCMSNLAKYKVRHLGCESNPLMCEGYARGIAKEFMEGSLESCRIGIGGGKRRGKTVKVIDLVEEGKEIEG